MKEPNYAPIYCALYPGFAEVTRAHGYALAVHGSLGRDMDLICAPWTDNPSDPKDVIDVITSKFAIRVIGDGPVVRNHGREAWTISVGFGECALDLSFMPRKTPNDALGGNDEDSKPLNVVLIGSEEC